MKTPRIFTPAKYAPGKVPFVYYSYRSGETGRMQRVKVYEGFSKVKPAQHQEHAEKLIEHINKKLNAGYDPFTESQRAQVVDTFSIGYYVDEALKGKKRWRASTIKSYTNAVRLFKEWLTATRKLHEPVMRFTEDDATDYLDWLENHHNFSPTSRNNHRGFMGTIFNLIRKNLRRRKLTLENYFLLVPRVPEDRKGRTPFNAKQVERIRKHLIHRDPELWLACLFVRYTMVRTSMELPQLRLNDIDTEKMKLTVRGEISKNHKTQQVHLHPEILELMNALGYFDYPGNFYIFSKHRRPGPEPYAPVTLTVRFSEQCRDKLKFSSDYSLYSFKHTGNAELHHRRTALPLIRDQNRHSDIRTTDIYSKQYGFYNEENVWSEK